MTGSQLKRVAFAVAIAVSGALTVFALESRGDSGSVEAIALYAPDPAGPAGLGYQVDPQTTEVGRSVDSPPGEVRWTFVSYASSEGRCTDLVAEQIGGSQIGRVSGCWSSESEQETLRWLVGGMELDGRWLNVVYGRASPDVSDVQVTLADGSSDTAKVVDGTWLIVEPTPNALGFAVKRIDALTSSGEVRSTVQPASTAQIAQQASRLSEIAE